MKDNNLFQGVHELFFTSFLGKRPASAKLTGGFVVFSWQYPEIC